MVLRVKCLVINRAGYAFQFFMILGAGWKPMFKNIKTAVVAIGMVCFVSFPVIARDESDGKSSTLAVEKIVCQKAVARTPSADVAYQSGVDVDGNPVTPADVSAPTASTASMVPDYVSVPLTIDLAKRLNYQLPAGAEMNSVLGNLSIYKDGRVQFNGQDLSPQVTALCAGETVPPVSLPISAQKDLPVANTESTLDVAPLQSETDSVVSESSVPETVEPVKIEYVFTPGKPPAGSVAPSVTTPYVQPGPPAMAGKAEPKAPGYVNPYLQNKAE